MKHAKKAILMLPMLILPLLGAGSALSASIEGEKLDSGLGSLPPYAEWAHHADLQHMAQSSTRVPGEKLDSGLGELPPYAEWASHPALRALAGVSTASEQSDPELEARIPHPPR